MRPTLLAAATLLLLAAPAHPADRPFPEGTSSQKLEGLNVSIVMPREFDPAAERSMVVVLHGAGGTETGMAGSLAHLAEKDYVVVAPKSKGATWDAGDLEAVRKITADLRKRLKIGERRLHGVGFSNGGWNLAPVAFDDELRFQSATWVAAGFKGGKPPKHAKKEMSVLALAGAEDGNRKPAEETPKLLEGKVRSAEVRIQPGLGHEWPSKLMPYFSWWLDVAEDRFVPGSCAAFEWKATSDAVVEAAVAAKSGGFVYWWSSADAGALKARVLQNDVLRDPLVQRFGNQLPAASVDISGSPEGSAKAGVKTTPAIVIYDATGKIKVVLQDKIDAKTLAAELRKVAPDKSLPKD